MNLSIPSRALLRTFLLLAAAILGPGLAGAARGQTITPRLPATFSASPSTPIAFRAAGAVSAAASGNVTPGLPAGFQPDDIHIAIIESKDNVIPAMPLGWNLLNTASSGAAHQASLFWRRAAAGDVAPTVTHTGGGSIIARIIGFSGTDRFSASPFDVANSFTVSPADTSVEAAAITTITPNTMLVMTEHIADNWNGLNLPTGNAAIAWAQAFFSNTTAGTDSAIGAHYGLAAAAGLQGALQSTRTTGGAAAISHGAQLALRPALTIDKPAGTVQDDVMIASIAARPNTVTITPPTGWTLVLRVDNAAATASSLAVYRKTAGASEPAQYTWAISASTGAAGGIQSFANVDTVNPIDVGTNPLDGQNTPSSTMHSTPNRTTSVPDTMLVTSHAYTSSGTWTPPGGMTERFDTASLTPNNAVGISIEGNNAIQAAAGATGAKTATATAAADVGNAHILALRPRVHHFALSVAGGAAADTCVAKNITITAQDVFNGTVTNYTGTINITTSTSHGDWSVVTASGVLVNGAADDGAATYSFVAADAGVITLALTNTHADDLTVTVQDSTRPSTVSTSITINFRGNDFVIANDPIQVAGRDQAMSATMRVGSTCGTTNTAYTGVKSLKAWLTRDAADPAGAAPAIGAASLPNAVPGANNLTLTFTAGVATFNLSTTDVGKYVLNLRDDTLTFATEIINGSSPAITTRPFGFHLSGTGIPGVTGPGGAVFKKAGENFDVTVTARAWQAADDTNNDGVPNAGADLSNNAALPSFGQEVPPETVTVTHTLVAPAAGAAGNITGGLFTGFSAGARTNAMTWDEVGSITLSAALTSGNYLGSGGNAAGSVSPVGRFTPDHFIVTLGTLTNRQALGCSPTPSTFTYEGEQLRVTFMLTARNGLATPTTTTNYSTSNGFAKLDGTMYTNFGFGAVDLADATPPLAATALTARVPSGTSSGTWVGGIGSFTADLAVSRAASPDGPFESFRLGVIPADTDLVTLRPADLDLDTDLNAVFDRVRVGSSKIRFGRLRILNAVGVSTLALIVPIQTEYWTGAGFALNSEDSCTTLDRANIALGTYAKSLNACETIVNLGSPATDTVTFASGTGTLKLSAPGAGNEGSVNLTPQLGGPLIGMYCDTVGGAEMALTSAAKSYLQGAWPGPTYDNNPTARGAFGVFGAQPKSFIFFRENY